MTSSAGRHADEFVVGLVQMTCAEDPDANRSKAAAGVRAAATQGAQVVCLQELFATPYFCQREDTAFFELAEPIPGPTTDEFRALARNLSVVIVVPVFEKRAPGLYHNSATVLDADGQLLGVYRKMHIPDDPQYYEKFYFAPGDLGYRTFDTAYARVGVLICWDQWYPEAARVTALQGAEVLCYPTAIGWLPFERATLGPAQQDAWQTIQRGHAIANGVYVVAANRVGQEGDAAQGLRFWGRSFVCDPQGQLLAEAPTERDAVLVARCSRARLEDQRRCWPFLRDRRIDSYAPILKRFIDHAASAEPTET